MRLGMPGMANEDHKNTSDKIPGLRTSMFNKESAMILHARNENSIM